MTEALDAYPAEKLVLAAADALYEGDLEFFKACEARWERRFGGRGEESLRSVIDDTWQERGWVEPPR